MGEFHSEQDEIIRCQKFDYILEIINGKKETDHVDFKQEFYKNLRQSDLPKDISAFANIAPQEEKFIIFGVDDKKRQIIGIDDNSLPSQDELDEYLSSTIDPFVHTEIGCIEYSKNVFIGYIKVLINNTDFPYVIKKTCGKNNKIQEGDIFIRKGTVIRKASRTDLDEMYSKNGEVLIKLRDNLMLIEPIEGIDPLVKNPTYGRFDLEIFNNTLNNILLDSGEIVISTDKHKVQRNIISILPNLGIRNNPLELSAGSRGIHACLFDFTSQDCVDFNFNSDGWMNNDVNVQIVLYDTDDNKYHIEATGVMLKAKGDILHKVRLKEKKERTRLSKNHIIKSK